MATVKVWGVITVEQDSRLVAGDDTLLDPVRFRYLFTDMEENIHIHYRDLRIELSRVEFEELVTGFRALVDAAAPSGEVLGYRLTNRVHYHPARVSIEECSDGFHLHLRNYKLLFSDQEFRRLLEFLRTLPLSGRASSPNDIEAPIRAPVNRTEWIPLPSYFSALDSSPSGDALNRLKLQVLNVIGLAAACGGNSVCSLDYRRWWVDPNSGQLSFPCGPTARLGLRAVESYRRRWLGFLEQRGVGLVEPQRHPYSAAQLNTLLKRVEDTLKGQSLMASVQYMRLLGAAHRGDLGWYSSGFATGGWAKAAMDIDVLVLLSEGAQVPLHWELVRHLPDLGCDAYYLGQESCDAAARMRRQYPYVDIAGHMLVGYVFCGPSAALERFLAVHPGRPIYERP